MKRIITALFILLAAIANIQAQYITLQGKQFYDQNGQPFYPLVCNYMLELAYQPSNTGVFELTPSSSYGTNPGYDDYGGQVPGLFALGPKRIKADFEKIKDMGFNTVRVLGLDLHKVDGLGGSLHARIYPLPQANPFDQEIAVSPPYASNSNMQNIVIPKVQELISIAKDAGVNVILLCGRDFLSPNTTSANDYAAYLKELAASLNAETNLLAYDLDNEPSWHTGYKNDSGVWIGYRTNKKKEICNNTASWYDAIKETDSHHLVTMGNGAISDVFDYDPAILKLDFNCFHLYPPFEVKEYENYDLQKAMSRIAIQMYWINKISPIPWIIGETGGAAWTAQGSDVFSQDQDSNAEGYSTLYPGQNVSKAPWVWGSFNDQTDLAVQTQQATINYGGSGYSWWQFQDVFWAGYNDGPTAFSDNKYGLLQWGCPDYDYTNHIFSYANNQNMNKPLVNDAFNPPVLTHSAAGNMPSNFYNPFGGSSATNYTVDGTITNGTEPAKDVLIRAGNPPKQHQDINGNWVDNYSIAPRWQFEIYTFTHDDGNFELISPIGHVYMDPLDPLSTDFSKFTQKVSYSAPGAKFSQIEWSSIELTLDNDTPTLYHSNFPSLIRQQNIFDNNGIDIPSLIDNLNSPKINPSRHILKVQNVVVAGNGIADFHASTEVDLQPGFESQLGSETDVYIATVDFDCTTLTDGTNAYKNDESKLPRKVDLSEKTIEVSYRLASSGLHLLPNPASDMVYIQTDAPTNATVEINGYGGSLVYADKLLIDKSIAISLGHLPSGCYFVKVKASEKSEIFKLIINKN